MGHVEPHCPAGAVSERRFAFACATMSYLDHRAVLGGQHAGSSDLVEVREHDRIHMSQHDPARTQIGQPLLEHIPADVARQLAGICEALDDEEIGTVGH